MFHKKGAHRNFENFKGKHLCQSLFFNKVASFVFQKPSHLFCHVLFCEFCEIFKNTIFNRPPLVAASENLSLHVFVLTLFHSLFHAITYLQESSPSNLASFALTFVSLGFHKFSRIMCHCMAIE